MRRVFRSIGRFDWIRPTILVLMICHVGRFYSDAPLALAICFEHNHQGRVAHDPPGADHDHEHQMESAETDPGFDPGFKVEHCRDTYLGMNLIPPTVLSLPADVAVLVPDVSAIVATDVLNAFPKELVLPIFHPPQLSVPTA